eukprot:CAMPEP_0176373258 /NCGR_PEP_ID=MMETSP0126-20121128/25917_1 /TAXON_ID=141414 ORGANISM="Strombidinopsis acuminatum, Strain SPMC142" /NCGR_SAMPLE_ID=MMETSP0126 /ASSEMBLY_ACC=CAM_ASM_000229 /LENGTH=109 /DNA_ID=CAMNT_0017733333 /DNA_START=569 /DNA_END=898 /DNA_ORIENTATION=+
MYIESRINECYYGLAGEFQEETTTDEDGNETTGSVDPSDCWWRSYYPQIPIWQRHFRDSWDSLEDDIVEWKCSDYEYEREDECADDDEFCYEDDDWYLDEEEFPIDDDF